MSGLLLEGGTWNLTGAVSGGARSVLGSTDQTPAGSLVCAAVRLSGAVLLGGGAR